jgi:hypothetical protein
MAGEMIDVYLNNDEKIVNTLCGQNKRLLEYEDGVIFGKNCVM